MNASFVPLSKQSRLKLEYTVQLSTDVSGLSNKIARSKLILKRFLKY